MKHGGQKRRRSKAIPKDIFGSTPKPTPTKKEVVKEPKPSSPPSLPKPIPPPSVVTTEEPEITEDEVIESPEPVIESPEEDLIQSQILGATRRKSIGLQPRDEEVAPESPSNGVSDKAQELIDESKLRALTEDVSPKPAAGKVPSKPIKLEPPKPKTPAKRPRRRRSSFQPAARAKRLDRSRHMEYKYEVRGLMVDIDVPEEHRSSILGTMWARGERQTVAEAKEFIEGKHSEGIVSEEQLTKLRDVLDKYTVRR